MKKVISVILLVVGFFSCKNKEVEKTNENLDPDVVRLTDAQYRNAGILTDTLRQQVISSVLKANGVIDVPPQNMVSVSIPLGGYLKFTKLIPGMHVQKGEVLAVLEDPQYIQLQQDYLTAKSQLVYTASEYHRQQQLNENKATSDKVFEQAKNTYTMQQIIVKSLEEKLELIHLNPLAVNAGNISKTINIHSPINGFVTAVNSNIGKYVNPSEVLFELVNPDDIHLKLTIFEKDLDKLSIGQELRAYTNTNPEIKHPCEILLIGKSLSADRSAEVHCHFKKYKEHLLPGMFMNADIDIKAKLVNTLPDDAFVRYENKDFLFIQTDPKTFSMVEVQKGNSENGYTELYKPDEFRNKTFVTKGAYNLLMTLKNSSEE
ncbi:MAG: efflux RND transporter periplasmic adaptor subunit [Bacteroidetes bacterium]|nr:efflux RND transporter periplasmic adaptor subunit [Bacteroidota bacterium]